MIMLKFILTMCLICFAISLVGMFMAYMITK